uniref:Secreted protein n=1 Tax=Steinernema glaseri TaxID=37863 RepID=A0A1I8ATD4_9BILA
MWCSCLGMLYVSTKSRLWMSRASYASMNWTFQHKGGTFNASKLAEKGGRRGSCKYCTMWCSCLGMLYVSTKSRLWMSYASMNWTSQHQGGTFNASKRSEYTLLVVVHCFPVASFCVWAISKSMFLKYRGYVWKTAAGQD